MALPMLRILRTLAPLVANASSLVTGLRGSAAAKMEDRVEGLERHALRTGEVLTGFGEQLQAIAEQLRLQAEQTEALAKKTKIFLAVAIAALLASVAALAVALA